MRSAKLAAGTLSRRLRRFRAWSLRADFLFSNWQQCLFCWCIVLKIRTITDQFRSLPGAAERPCRFFVGVFLSGDGFSWRCHFDPAPNPASFTPVASAWTNGAVLSTSPIAAQTEAWRALFSLIRLPGSKVIYTHRLRKSHRWIGSIWGKDGHGRRYRTWDQRVQPAQAAFRQHP